MFLEIRFQQIFKFSISHSPQILALKHKSKMEAITEGSKALESADKVVESHLNDPRPEKTRAA